MITNLNAIEKEFELTDNNIFKLRKLIEDSYIQHKITKEEKNMYEMKLNKLIFQTNNKELIYIYSKKRDDEIERQHNMYLNKQLYFDDSPLVYDIYKKIINYISSIPLIIRIFSRIKSFFK
jgi:hypothetical protein